MTSVELLIKQKLADAIAAEKRRVAGGLLESSLMELMGSPTGFQVNKPTGQKQQSQGGGDQDRRAKKQMQLAKVQGQLQAKTAQAGLNQNPQSAGKNRAKVNVLRQKVALTQAELQAMQEDEAKPRIDKTNPNDHIHDRIQQHLGAHHGNRILIATHTKATLYHPKHASMFTKPKSDEKGVYVARGKGRDYVRPEYVQFAHDSAAKPPKK